MQIVAETSALNEYQSQTFPPFSLSRLLQTVFTPPPGERIAILIDLKDPRDMKDHAYLADPKLTIQRIAHDTFYEGLHDGVMAELGMTGGEMFAYAITGGSNLDLPDLAVDAAGRELSLERDIYPNYDLILCISTYSATAPIDRFREAIRLSRSDPARGKSDHPGVRPLRGLRRGEQAGGKAAVGGYEGGGGRDRFRIGWANLSTAPRTGRPGSAKEPRPLPRRS